MDSVITIPAISDNYIYLYRYNQNDSLAVDPSDSSLVMKILQEHGLSLKTILITHHHWDHVAGAADLKQKTGCKVIGADRRRIPGIDTVAEDGQITKTASSGRVTRCSSAAAADSWSATHNRCGNRCKDWHPFRMIRLSTVGTIIRWKITNSLSALSPAIKMSKSGSIKSGRHNVSAGRRFLQVYYWKELRIVSCVPECPN